MCVCVCVCEREREATPPCSLSPVSVCVSLARDERVAVSLSLAGSDDVVLRW